MDSGGGPQPDSGPLQLTPELLADLQAGLLDDATAGRVRRQARNDPEAARVIAGLDAVRRELAHLGADEESAPAVPARVTARVGAALRTAPPPDPAAGRARPRLTGVQRAGLVTGLCAAAAAVVLGVVRLPQDPGPAHSAGPTAAAPGGFPVPAEQLHAALSQPQDLGPLADPQRLASCLTGLGHSPTLAVLGGRRVEVTGRPALLLLLPGSTPEQINAVVVAPTCNAVHTGLVAETVLARR
ncbi:hypothetical protein [Mycolicibacterium hippocampi]|uniref:hypothetical protein n=1 Tax=Mycolicibacterium hippocampi TaxID=659824 RepID=UPI0035174D64